MDGDAALPDRPCDCNQSGGETSAWGSNSQAKPEVFRLVRCLDLHPARWRRRVLVCSGAAIPLSNALACL